MSRPRSTVNVDNSGNPRQVILYVEDDESDAFLFQHACERVGITHRIVTVSNGKAAIAYLNGVDPYAERSQNPLPSLILLDLNLPGISGLELLKWIRATPELSTLLIVILSSSNQDTDINSAYTQGANGYLVKPANLEGIIAMARSVKDFWLVQNRASGWLSAKPLS